MEGNGMGSGNHWWRALIVIVVLVGLPALAMPRVSNTLNDWIYGNSKDIVPPLPPLKIQAEDSATTAVATAKAKQLLADWEEEEDAAEEKPPIARLGFQNDAVEPTPKNMAAPPLLSAPAVRQLPYEEPIEPVTRPGSPDSLARVREIKDQLAIWGAEYILLEDIDQGTKFRFCCLMTRGKDSQATFPFESTAPDAAVAAESVLSAVKAWRKQPAIYSEEEEKLSIDPLPR
jgi:hypothetical protein